MQNRKLHLNAKSPLALSKLDKYVLSWFSILPWNPKVHSLTPFNQIFLDVLPGFGLDTAHSVCYCIGFGYTSHVLVSCQFNVLQGIVGFI